MNVDIFIIFITNYIDIELKNDLQKNEFYVDDFISNQNILKNLIFCNKFIYNLIIKLIKYNFIENNILFYSKNIYKIIKYKLSDTTKYKLSINVLNKFKKSQIDSPGSKYYKYKCNCDRCKNVMVLKYWESYNMTYAVNKYCLHKYNKYNMINKTLFLKHAIKKKKKPFKFKSPRFIYIY